MFSLGKRSKRNYNTLHEDLKKIIDLALELSQVDFVITEGHRSLARQKKLFDQGKSQIDGINKRGKHNYDPSLAFDFCVYVPGKKKLAFDHKHLMYLVGVFTTVGAFLYLNGHISHRVRSGSNWDLDGQLLYDQTFWDMPHIELIK